MRRCICLLLVSAVLCGCAAGGLPSISGTVGSPDTPQPNAVSAAEPAPQNGGVRGIWANFSSNFSSGDQPVQAPKPAADAFALDPNEALRLVNDYRSSRGLPALTLDRNATGAAEILAKDMAKHDHMSHIGPNGADVGKRLVLAGYHYRIAAENVGVGQKSLAEVVEGWKKSPPHSRNMLLAEATHMGIAYQYKPDTKWKTFWTLVMAAPDGGR